MRQYTPPGRKSHRRALLPLHHSLTANAGAKRMCEEEYREVLAIDGMASETNRLVAALGVPVDVVYEVE